MNKLLSDVNEEIAQNNARMDKEKSQNAELEAKVAKMEESRENCKVEFLIFR